jgi:hypothetical protein
MNTRRLIAAFFVVSSAASVALAALAADSATIPTDSIARKTALLFSDDFGRAERDTRWHRVVDTFAVDALEGNAALKGTQTRDKEMSSKDGKSTIAAHAAVFGLELPTKDSVVECRIRFEGATMIDVEFDDRKYTGAHYGHLCRAQIRPDRVTLLDEREGSQNMAIRELRKDPVTNKDEISRRLAGRSASFPAKLETGRWYSLVVETVGDEMRVTIDGKPAGYLKSPGIGHPTKSKIELGVGGKDGWFDDIKVWNAEPVKQGQS